jgi:hypothetical protein
MNNSTLRWTARAGALLVLLGFVLPCLTVSCGGMPGLGQSFSLIDLASQANQPLLYLAPIAILVMLVASFMSAASHSQERALLYVQFGGLVVSILAVLLPLLSLYNQVGSTGGVFQVSPEVGMFFLIGGYLLVGIPLGIELSNPPAQASEPAYSFAPAGDVFPAPRPQHHGQPAFSLPTAPSLELLRGDLPFSVIPLNKSDISLGRSKDNDLQIPDTQASRHHARLRQAQGAWYIQDQNSAGGTYVNNELVQAVRLNSGDQITIGETTFIFRA